MQSRTEVNFPAGFIAERLGVGVTDLFPKNKDKNEKKGNIELTAICRTIFVKRDNIYMRKNHNKREKSLTSN